MRNKKAAFLVTLFCTFIGLAVIASSCGDPENAPVSAANDKRVVSPAMRGSEIIAEYLKTDAAPFRKSRVRITTYEEGNAPDVYEIETTRKQSEGETRILTQVVRPSEDSDLASLTVEAKGKPTSVTSYVSSRDEFRETDTNKMFFGGLTASELLGEWDKFDHKFINEKEIDGKKVFEIESTLKKGGSSLIQRMSILIRADNFLPLELRLYDEGGRHIRTYSVIEFKSDEKGPYAAKTKIENLVYKNTTEIEILDRDFPAAIDDTFFTRERLKEIGGKKK